MDRVQREALHRDLARLADGDRDAFHPVFVRLWPLLRGFTARHLPPADAEDVAQEALLKVFARAAEFDARRDGLSWVLGIAAWEVRTAWRRRWRRREDPAEPSLLERHDPAADPEEATLAREREAALHAALGALGAAEAETLRAYALEDPPPVKGATFRKRVQRALARLRAAWRTSHGHP